MFENLKLGLKDILHNKTSFILLQIVTLFISIVITSTYDSIRWEYHRNRQQMFIEDYMELVPVSTDVKDNSYIQRILDEVLNDNISFVCNYNNEFSDQYGMPVVVAFGNIERLSDVFKSDLKEMFYTNSHTITQSKATYLNHTYPIKQIDHFDFHEALPSEVKGWLRDEGVLLVVKDQDILSYMDQNDPEQLFSLIKSLPYNQEVCNKLNDILKDSPYQLATINTSIDSSFMFIMKYILPYLVLAILALIIGVHIFNTVMFAKLRKEFTIHLLCGATIKDIIIRSSTNLLLILFINVLLVTYLAGRSVDMGLRFVSYITILIPLVVLEMSIICQIKHRFFIENIRGGLS